MGLLGGRSGREDKDEGAMDRAKGQIKEAGGADSNVWWHHGRGGKGIAPLEKSGRKTTNVPLRMTQLAYTPEAQ